MRAGQDREELLRIRGVNALGRERPVELLDEVGHLLDGQGGTRQPALAKLFPPRFALSGCHGADANLGGALCGVVRNRLASARHTN